MLHFSPVRTTILRTISNIFMTLAWYEERFRRSSHWSFFRILLCDLFAAIQVELSRRVGFAHKVSLRQRLSSSAEEGPFDKESGPSSYKRSQAQLIEDLLDISRITMGKLRLDVRPLQPASVINAAVESLLVAAEARRIRIQRVLDSHAGPIAGDFERLQQVVWNLLSNAIKFTTKDGRVQIVWNV